MEDSPNEGRFRFRQLKRTAAGPSTSDFTIPPGISWVDAVDHGRMSMNHFIFGLATDHAQVLKAMTALAEVGIASDQVSVLMADRQESGALATKIQAKAAHGSFSAGNIGGGLGWLAGLSALAIPGIGLFFAAGPIVGFLTGIAVGRAVGSHRGAMIEEMGIPDIAVDHYDAAMKNGRILLAARCEEPALAERVGEALRQVGLEDVDSTSGAGRQAEPPNA